MKTETEATFKYKNLTVCIKREYGKDKRLEDIINKLILQKSALRQSKIA